MPHQMQLIGKAFDFLKFLFQYKESTNINSIFLFGSVARNEFTEKSDIDLFIDVAEKRKEKIIKKIVNLALSKFYSTESEKWNLLNIPNEFSVQVGKLSEWELKKSIEKEGILLYSKSAISTKGMPSYLVVIQPIKDIVKRNRVMRKLHGRKKPEIKGLLHELNAKILAPRIFVIPREKAKTVFQYLAKEKIDYSFYPIVI